MRLAQFAALAAILLVGLSARADNTGPKTDAAKLQSICVTRALQGHPCDAKDTAKFQAELSEERAIWLKVKVWQPRGYKDAGDGVEGLSDAEVDALPAAAAAALARLNILRADLGEQTIPPEKVKVAVDEITGFAAAEKACRADRDPNGGKTQGCMLLRAAQRRSESFEVMTVEPMCDADMRREQATAAMAHEQANPSGYVDRALLHALGGDLQAYREQLAGQMPAFVKVRHRAWRGYRVECPGRTL